MKLREIDLTKKGRTGHDHPDIKPWPTQYLCRINKRFFAGYFTRLHFGWSFSGWFGGPLQYDRPGTNSSSWERLWEIIDDTT